MARAHRLLAAELQELAGQVHGAVGGGPDAGDRGEGLARYGRIARGLFDVHQDRGQDVVEVVRDAAGELPDRLHLLRLAALLFDGPPLRDVLRDPRDAVDPVGRVAHRERAIVDQPDLAVGADDPVLDVVRAGELER